ncbi:MAG: type II secretion system inner membrane protein GspF [Gammaproteobacteria bacterium]|nr:type II secretion system inner membrane protein GspF [Gammaproteobacteria bacterium]MDH5651494.1 type II secretion system inner membrane protein GspF [Gammaproteobacteria bacterium]
MGAFEYAALDSAGKEKKGLLEGDSPRQIRQMLRDKGLIPLRVEEVAQKESARRQGSFRMQRGISATDLALLTRQLATLSRSGLPLDEATATVAKQTDKPRLKRLMMGVRAKVVEGHSLAEGLGSFPHVFPDLYRATVAAGEQSGHLDAVLERLADYTESRQQLQQRMQLALFYPIILTVIAVSVVTGLMTYVVPKVVEVFISSGQKLPTLTVVMIAISDFLRNYGLFLLAGLFATGLGIGKLLQQPGPRRKYHRFLLRLPVVGKLVRGMNTARFARTLSILAASGVPVLEALRISSAVVSNIPMREAVEEAALRVREGAALGKSLERSGFFPPITVNLISSGEVSGKLEEMLERAAANQERELETITAMLMGMLEPIMILVMGVVVMLIVLAILLPVLNMSNLIG